MRTPLASLFITLSLCITAAANPNWPSFRGQGDSATTATILPLTWSADENLAWSVDLKGYGQSSPVVFDGRIFVTSIEGPMKEKLHVAAYDLKTGKLIWTKSFDSTEHRELNDYVSKAAPTPIVDAKHLITFFESGDLIAFDHAGKILWQRSLSKEYGPFLGNHGIGASPAQTEKEVIVLVDHAGPGYLIAIDKATGKNVWKTPRESRVSWSSPIVAKRGDVTEILISSNGIIEAFDAANGKRIWYRDGFKGNTVASPTAAGDAIYIGGSEASTNLALKRGGKDELPDDHFLWRAETASSSFASPLVFRDTVYFTSKAGIAFALEAATGREIWRQRMGDSCWASPIGVDDRIYFFLTRGKTLVIKPGVEPQIIAENSLSVEGRVYGVAPVNGAFIIRSGTKLYCVGKVKD